MSDFEPADAFAYEELSASDILVEWSPDPERPLVATLPPLAWRPGIVRVRRLTQLREWDDDDPPPAFSPVGDGPVFQGEPELANILINKSTDVEGNVTLSEARWQRRWRLCWQVPTDPMTWAFVHLRYRLKHILNELEGSFTITYGDPVEIWWTGAVPVGYDPEDSETWPGTEWVEQAIPDCPPPPDPDPESALQNEATTVMEWLWPKAGLFLDEYWPEGALFAPGVIPGAFEEAYVYQRPKSRGLFLGGPDGEV
jgi:hypothetical protein